MILRPMLAAREVPSKIRLPVLASFKYDGLRALDTGQGSIMSRHMKPLPNRATQEFFRCHDLMGLDGEMIVGDPTSKNENGVSNVFNRTQSGVMSEDGDPGAVFYVFDNFGAGLRIPFHLRAAYIRRKIDWLPRRIRDRVVIVRQRLICHLSELWEFEQEAVESGYEGLICRDPQGPYKQNRATELEGWMWKLKRFKDDEGIITGYYELEHNDNPQETNELGLSKRRKLKEGMRPGGTLGGFILDWRGKVLRVGTGKGLDRKLRDFIWANQEKFMGWPLKFKYQEVGMKDLPRTPIAIGPRHWLDL